MSESLRIALNEAAAERRFQATELAMDREQRHVRLVDHRHAILVTAGHELPGDEN